MGGVGQLGQRTTNRYKLIVLLAALACVGILVFSFDQRNRQATGVCVTTGQRLSDAQILDMAEKYAGSLVASDGVGRLPVALIGLRIVPESALRPEEEVPAWVRNAGGFRAYVEIVDEKGNLADQYGRPLLIVVSNCGDFRNALHEYPRVWVW